MRVYVCVAVRSRVGVLCVFPCVVASLLFGFCYLIDWSIVCVVFMGSCLRVCVWVRVCGRPVGRSVGVFVCVCVD